MELTSTSFNSWPAFSPDGNPIAFSSSRDGNFDIYVMELDGGKVARLTRSLGMDIRPAWSLDGRRLAFTSNPNGRDQIFLMQPDGPHLMHTPTDHITNIHLTSHPATRPLLL